MLNITTFLRTSDIKKLITQTTYLANDVSSYFDFSSNNSELAESSAVIKIDISIINTKKHNETKCKYFTCILTFAIL